MTLLQDLRYAFRMLRRSPGFTAVAILVLALGIGANTAIFSIVNAVLLEPLPFRAPGQLVQMYETETAPGSYPLSGPDFPDWRAQSKLFAGMTLYGYQRSYNLSGDGTPDRIIGTPVDANFFNVLGTPPLLGRTLAPGEDQPGKSHVVVLSYPLWQSRFAGDRGVLGRTMQLNGEPYTIIGVMPASFRWQGRVQLWPAMEMSSTTLGQRGNHSFSAIGRMRPGVTLAQAQAEISAIALRLQQQYPNSNFKTGASLFAMRDRLVRQNTKDSLRILICVVGLVLLIACANVANLMLARALARQKEMSIRIALGARRGRIIRQLLTESVLLSLCGAAAGAALAWAGVRFVTTLKAFTLPQFNPIAVEGRVLGFTVLLALASGVLFGLAPALQLSNPNMNDELKGAGALVGVHRRRRWLSDSLVVAEIAVSLVLVVGAGLFLQSFVRMRSLDVGLNPDHLVVAAVTLPAAAYDTPGKQDAFARELLARAQALPGVQAAALSSELPLEGGNNGYIRLKEEAGGRNRTTLVEWTEISRDYFKTLGIPLVRGSAYSDADFAAWMAAYPRSRQLGSARAPAGAAAGQRSHDSQRPSGAARNQEWSIHLNAQASPGFTNALSLPVVITQTTARQYWPGQNPLGREFSQGSSDGPWLRVIGVVADTNIFGLGVPNIGHAYFPASGLGGLQIEVRTNTPKAAVGASLQREVQSLDSTLAVYNLRTMDEVIGTSAAGQAFQSGLMAAFALLALLLAVAGIYGVMSYIVGQRTREIGIRMALGADRGQVSRLILGGGLRLGLSGIALGIVAALAAGRLIASQLVGVKPTDPAVLAAAPLVLLAACLLACYLPARRASKVDPNQALRY